MALLPERLPLRPALAASVLVGGGLIAGELLHGLGGSLGLVAVAGLGLWLLQGRGRKPLDRLPSSPEGLVSHCRELLQQFEALDLPVAPRQGQLEALLALGERQECHVGLVGAAPSPEFWQLLQQQLKGRKPVLLHQAEPFPGCLASGAGRSRCCTGIRSFICWATRPAPPTYAGYRRPQRICRCC